MPELATIIHTSGMGWTNLYFAICPELEKSMIRFHTKNKRTRKVHTIKLDERVIIIPGHVLDVSTDTNSVYADGQKAIFRGNAMLNLVVPSGEILLERLKENLNPLLKEYHVTFMIGDFTNPSAPVVDSVEPKLAFPGLSGIPHAVYNRMNRQFEHD